MANEIKASATFDWFDHWGNCKKCQKLLPTITRDAPNRGVCRIGKALYKRALRETIDRISSQVRAVREGRSSV